MICHNEIVHSRQIMYTPPGVAIWNIPTCYYSLIGESYTHDVRLSSTVVLSLHKLSLRWDLAGPHMKICPLSDVNWHAPSFSKTMDVMRMHLNKRCRWDACMDGTTLPQFALSPRIMVQSSMCSTSERGQQRNDCSYVMCPLLSRDWWQYYFSIKVWKWVAGRAPSFWG